MINTASIKHSFETYGAQVLLTIQGATPEDLARTVNTYCNHGMFLPAAIPAQYDETRHTSVTVNVTKEKLLPALRSLAEVNLIRVNGTLPREARLKGEAFDRRAEQWANEMFATFQKTASVTALNAAESGVADLRDYTLSAEENTPWLRKAARRMLAGLATAKRDSAPRAARSQAE